MGKENGASRNPPNRHSKSLRMERGFFSINDNQANRSQSFSAAAARGVRPIPLHPSPAELERRHSQNVRRRHTGLFGSRPAVKVPRVESALNMFTKLQAGLSECATYLQEALNSVEPKRKRLVEQRIRLLESRLHEMEELFQLYMYQQKIREGSKNLIHALGQQGSKDGLDKCKSSYKECTERLCALEEELESKLGIFRIKIEGLAGFGRLCSGDTYDVLIKHGSSFKWKARCKIDKDGQRWIDSEFPLLPRINDELSIRVVEMRKIQANLSVGNIILRSRTYIKARPQTFSVPLNSTGSMKLKLTVEWRPFSGTAENTIRSKRPQSLLSEVIFVPGGENNDAMSISTSPAHSQGSNKNLQSNNSLNDSEDGQRKYTPERVHHIAIIADSPPVFERDYILGNGISEEPEEFRHATSLDRAVMHLIPTFQSHKDQYPELQLMIKQLEKLEEILKKCSLSRSSISISVESALESFDFLEDNEDEVESSARSVKSDGSWHQDTGYNSTDDFGRDSGEEGCAKSPLKLPQFTPDTIVEASESNSSTEIIETCFGKEEFEISYKFRKREDKDETNKESGKSDQDKGDVGSKEDEAQGVAMEDLEALGATGNRGSINDGVGRSRPISPNLSSSDSQDVTVGNKALDKVILAHLQLCEELTGFLGSFGPMKFKETIALAKLRRQARVLELLLDLAIHNDNEEITLERACPGLFSNVLVCSIWQNSIRASPLYVLAKDVRESFEERFNSQIKQSYNRVADSVFPTIIGRIIHQDGDIIEPIVEDDEVISVYQYENFLLEHSRHNTTKYVDEIAYELLISRRLLSTEKEAVVAQLKQYSEVPLTRICFCAVLSLLVDTDRHLVQAAESFLCSLIKDSEARRKAVTLATEALEESDDRLREGACLALTVLQVKDCIAQLRYLSRCDVPNVKIAAKKALSSFGESEDSSRGEPFSSNAGLEGLLY